MPTFLDRARRFYTRYWLFVLAAVVLLPVGYGFYVAWGVKRVADTGAAAPPLSHRKAVQLRAALVQEQAKREVAEVIALAAGVTVDSAKRAARRHDVAADSTIRSLHTTYASDDEIFTPAAGAAAQRLDRFLSDYRPGAVALPGGSDTIR